MLPSLFLSHGSPILPLVKAPARSFLLNLGRQVEATWGRPRAIVIASAHWATRDPAVSAMPVNTTIHDFRGFPAFLYRLRYDAPGAPDLAAEIATLLPATLDPHRGLDHGAWCPLILAWPQADIPVLQVSIQPHLGSAHHLRLGAALRGLRQRDVLVIGSGSLTHDLGRLAGQDLDAPQPDDVVAFCDWMHRALTEGRTEELLAWDRLAPHGARQHPTDEHLLPLFVALGAGGPDVRRLHRSATYGALRMDAYAFAG